MKIVINTDFGGFSLSHEAIMRYAELSGTKLYFDFDKKPKLLFGIHYHTNPECTDESYFSTRDINRNDPFLVQTVEELKDKANGPHAKLKVVEIPDDVQWHISEYDGLEHIAENHRTWS